MKEKYKQFLKEVLRHYEILEKTFRELEKLKSFPLSEKDIKELKETLHTLSLLDTIAYRFSKLQEGIGKLLRIYLTLKGEETEELFMKDIINLAEKRGLFINWETWVFMRELRNILTHEYPEEEETIAETLNKVKVFTAELNLLISQLKEEP
ncbi:MAG: hypothetical protein C0169_06450 [Thermodesulfobacterium geofontis]|uniref:DUF86 domain-containing protein n=1 Tax=Thermodesulfobacterium geofontis TaxID=1295609 RepID=A0A2N7Q8G4_9BACT|nr:MAG: hypothetical protein C0169_06450 [Thermodesulfobacterium geofontis]HEM56275.1 hypothetical protein [Thermodesulfobium narugense]